MIEKILDKFFTREQVARPGLYLDRWVIKRYEDGRALYLHHFLGSDYPEVHHDHPKDFVSIGLWGSYVDCYMDSKEWKKSEEYNAPFFRKFPAEHRHYIWLPEGKTAWTLVKTGPVKQEWGFYPDGYFVPWKDYINLVYGEEQGTVDQTPSPSEAQEQDAS
jgi:hypothetical protein